jgi:hypothetical protein
MRILRPHAGDQYRRTATKACPSCRYFLTPKSSLEADLQDSEASCARQQTELAKNKELIVKDLKAVEGEIKELVQNQPELAQRILAS